MINNQNIAVMSEKIAQLEAAIKTAGIELPTVTADDNGKSLQVVAGKWAKGVILDAEHLPYNSELSIKDKLDIVGVKIVSTVVTISASESAYSDADKTLDSVTGYTPIAVAGYALNDPNKFMIKALISNGHLIVTVGTKGTQIYSGNADFNIIYVKDAMIIS